LRSLAAAGAAAALPGIPLLNHGNVNAAVAAADPQPAAESFDFVFFTDTHIQPELDAAHGCQMAFAKIAAAKPEFAICGGDMVFDALDVPRTRADMLFDLYQRTEATIQAPLYHTIGNHDLYGILSKSGAIPTDPGYGKKMFEDRIGARTYYSFDHRGYHFIVLDSIFPTPDRLWEGRIDDAQLRWLAHDLAAIPPAAPIVVITHVPLITGYLAYGPKPDGTQRYDTVSVANSAAVIALFATHNKDCQYACCGAVCGNWWHGPRLDFPEGFTIVSLREGKISWRYETYGFQSVAPNPRYKS
jgi:Icc protein